MGAARRSPPPGGAAARAVAAAAHAAAGAGCAHTKSPPTHALIVSLRSLSAGCAREMHSSHVRCRPPLLREARSMRNVPHTVERASLPAGRMAVGKWQFVGRQGGGREGDWASEGQLGSCWAGLSARRLRQAAGLPAAPPPIQLCTSSRMLATCSVHRSVAGPPGERWWEEEARAPLAAVGSPARLLRSLQLPVGMPDLPSLCCGDGPWPPPPLPAPAAACRTEPSAQPPHPAAGGRLSQLGCRPRTRRPRARCSTAAAAAAAPAARPARPPHAGSRSFICRKGRRL